MMEGVLWLLFIALQIGNVPHVGGGVAFVPLNSEPISPIT